jgi:hypothetical protein
MPTNNNFRNLLKNAFFKEGFTVSDIYGSNNSPKYKPEILREIDPDDKKEPENDQSPQKDNDTPQSDTASPDDPLDNNSPSPEQSSNGAGEEKEKGPDDTSATGGNGQDNKEQQPERPRPKPDPITPPEPIKTVETPEQKVVRLYTDTGDADTDYSNTSENNIRLGKFKFDNAGLKLDKVLTEDDLEGGISTKDIENRLTPEQHELYKEKNKELRKKYPLIDMREKMCLIHNAHIPFTKRDEKWNDVKIEPDQRKQAYLKLNEYMEEHFTKHWQDKLKYVNFLKTIKINFSDKPAIRANLISSKGFISEENENIIPLNKVYAQVPKSIQELLLDNSEDPVFVKSNIFRTLNSSFDQEIAASNSLYVILNKDNIKYGDDTNGGDLGDTEDDKGDDEEDKNDEELTKSENGEKLENPTPEEAPPEETGKEGPKEENGEEGLVPIGQDVEI